jgi:hypothetical protein
MNMEDMPRHCPSARDQYEGQVYKRARAVCMAWTWKLCAKHVKAGEGDLVTGGPQGKDSECWKVGKVAERTSGVEVEVEVDRFDR